MVVVCSNRSHDHNWQTNSRRQDPVADIDNLGIAGSPEVQSFHGVAHGNVAIYTHSGQREDACKHVVIVNRHDNLAQEVPKRPGAHEIVHTLEGEGTGSQGICQGQVKDVDVCRSLHFGVSVVNRSRW